eukprot:364625-Chlamydomonas_euryale.AAC.5
MEYLIRAIVIWMCIKFVYLPHFEMVLPMKLNNENMGFNGCVLAYGQTGSGKTFTMGTAAAESEFHAKQPRGVVPQTMRLLFSYLQNAMESYNITLKVRVYSEDGWRGCLKAREKTLTCNIDMYVNAYLFDAFFARGWPVITKTAYQPGPYACTIL